MQDMFFDNVSFLNTYFEKAILWSRLSYILVGVFNIFRFLFAYFLNSCGSMVTPQNTYSTLMFKLL